MARDEQPKYSLSARFLGPIINLNVEIDSRAQNLIFARNGTGKSFLARAFRQLDLHGQGAREDDAGAALVSDESTDGRGEFCFACGPQELGRLTLQKLPSESVTSTTETIFHVFSDEFVHSELRSRSFEINGEIENIIAVDSVSIELTDAKETLATSKLRHDELLQSLKIKLMKEKVKELNEKAEVNKLLKQYSSLTAESLMARFAVKPTKSERTLQSVVVELDKLRSIPTDPAYPNKITQFYELEPTLNSLDASLERVTSLSSVSAGIKAKIEAHREFYKVGTEIVIEHELSNCPFCEQSTENAEAEDLIGSFIDYFNDEEAKHKAELRIIYSELSNVKAGFENIGNQLVRQISKYNNLKEFIPSQKELILDDFACDLSKACKEISLIQNLITEKAANLTEVKTVDYSSLVSCVQAMMAKSTGNSQMLDQLQAAIEKSDDERKGLQREACKIFEEEFANQNWHEIEQVKESIASIANNELTLRKLDAKNPSDAARVRVAETFEMLLRSFFSEKYVFDKDAFTLKRGDREMVRGVDRTLSDGEKTVIAFCYFVASVHRKVSTSSDYSKLFIVFDDPVTSMSFDYIFSIAQILKNIGISNAGLISINPSEIAGQTSRRPRLLILTHSSYFFNICLTNRVVQDRSAFALSLSNNEHSMSRLKSYVAPFQDQLSDILDVVDGKSPDHHTGNAVRSVLEAVGRFCRPDKADQLTNFITFLAGDEGFLIKSVMINSLSHGTYVEHSPSPDDLRLACEEVKEVVRRFAPGQIEILRPSV